MAQNEDTNSTADNTVLCPDSSMRLARIIEHSLNEIYVIDADSLTFICANRSARTNTGYSASELERLTPLALKPDVSRATWDRLTRPLRNGKRKLTRFKTPHERKGRSRYDVSVHLEYMAEEAPAVFVAFIEDLTTQRLAEADQRDSEVLLETVIETAPDAIITIDADGLIGTFSAAAEKMLGYSADEVIGKNVKILMPSPYRDEHDGYLERYKKTGEKRIIGIGRRVVALRKDGTKFPMELAVGEVNQGGTRLFTGFIRDISNRVEMEERANILQRDLNHAARLTAMGEMASALAHEINQPLAAISNYAQVIKKILANNDTSNSKQREFNIRSPNRPNAPGTSFAAFGSLSGGLKLSGVGRISTMWFEKAAQLALVGATSNGIAVSLHLEDGLPDVMLDRIQIQQVIVNLVRNAMDSLQEIGQREIEIKTHLDDRVRAISVRSDSLSGREVLISVHDTGLGIAEDVLGKLFEPFVTTKETGMGSAVSVQVHHRSAWRASMGGK